SSGYGIAGGRGRCFVFWQEFRKCYAMADRPQDCALQLDDYFECLHHTKEKARARKIKAEEVKQIEKKRQEDEKARKSTNSTAKSNVTRLGIIDDQKSSSNSDSN
ncbi:14034_t:CDS:2, partial [Gigaspora rosea]